MAKAKRLKWENMTEEQREKARRASVKWGIPVEEIRMTTTGLIVNPVERPGDLAGKKRQMVAKGWADSVADITEEMIRQYDADCEKQGKARPVRLK